MRTRRTTTVVSLAVLVAGAVASVAEQDVPALKDVFKDRFLIGGALNRRVVTGHDPGAAAIAEKHFNTATAENAMKWQSLNPWPGRYSWGVADSFVAFCERNEMAAIGHCLVWHSQVPRWLFRDESGNALTREVLLALSLIHI